MAIEPGGRPLVGQTDYQLFRDFLERSCGILLGDDKEYLVRSRIGRIMQEQGIETLGELAKRLDSVQHRLLRKSVLDAMTTNETMWFRDGYPFDILRDRLLPELAKSKQKVRIWSAACSSGQEPYSISITVEEYLSSQPAAFPGGIEIMATDLSSLVLQQAQLGLYAESALARGLSPERRRRFFDPIDGENYQLKSSVRGRVSFRQINLLEDFSSLGSFNLIFCRNVLLYFSMELKREILRRLRGRLLPAGYLLLGASETTLDLSHCYQMEYCNPGVIHRAC